MISATFFSMWRIDSDLGDADAPYDRAAAVYDRLVRSRAYNRLAWSTSPDDYAEFAAAAIASSDGPLLEVAAGSAAATAELHGRARRPTTLVDLSRAMLERAGRRIQATRDDHQIVTAAPIRLVQADLLDLPFPAHGFTTVLGLGFTHLFDDLPAVVGALRRQLAPGGELYLAGLVTQTLRGNGYLRLLHRAGQVARAMTAESLRGALGQPIRFGTIGCMAYATLPAGDDRSPTHTR
ncbi:MAG: hypothetical protein DLM54_09385 [Acidimicrobiales bacterium]|nr:MAG: hypothetical protein DLM54_09385 [Acidimicrobiales bacterium]